MSELGDRLRELHASKKPYPTSAHGQMCGTESYRIVASGNSLNWMIEAADALDAMDVKMTTVDGEVNG
jgi:hypothetical protein